jgi:hypothetical protein
MLMFDLPMMFFPRKRSAAYTCTISKSALATPQSGQTQFSGISAHAVPGLIPSAGKPAASSYMKPQTTHCQTFMLLSLRKMKNQDDTFANTERY